MADDDVQLTDLEVIQQFSLAVRGATASRAAVIAALEADLAFLGGSRPAGRAANRPAAPTLVPAEQDAAVSLAKEPAPPAAPTRSLATRPVRDQAAAKAGPAKAKPVKAAPGKPARAASAKAAPARKATVKPTAKAAPARAAVKKAAPVRKSAVTKKAPAKARGRRA